MASKKLPDWWPFDVYGVKIQRTPNSDSNGTDKHAQADQSQYDPEYSFYHPGR